MQDAEKFPAQPHLSFWSEAWCHTTVVGSPRGVRGPRNSVIIRQGGPLLTPNVLSQSSTDQLSQIGTCVGVTGSKQGLLQQATVTSRKLSRGSALSALKCACDPDHVHVNPCVPDHVYVHDSMYVVHAHVQLCV